MLGMIELLDLDNHAVLHDDRSVPLVGQGEMRPFHRFRAIEGRRSETRSEDGNSLPIGHGFLERFFGLEVAMTIHASPFRLELFDRSRIYPPMKEGRCWELLRVPSDVANIPQ